VTPDGIQEASRWFEMASGRTSKTLCIWLINYVFRIRVHPGSTEYMYFAILFNFFAFDFVVQELISR